MKKLVLFLALFISSTSYAVATCKVCVQVDRYVKEYEEDEQKAYEAFTKYFSQVPLSKNKAVRTKEIAALIKASDIMKGQDDRLELAEYLFDIHKNYPLEFKESLGAVSKESQKRIESQIKVIKDLREKGEP